MRFGDYRGYFVDVVIEAEDGASEQEGLCDVDQQAVSNGVYLDDLVRRKRDAADYQQHRASVLSYFREFHLLQRE